MESETPSKFSACSGNLPRLVHYFTHNGVMKYSSAAHGLCVRVHCVCVCVSVRVCVCVCV